MRQEIDLIQAIAKGDRKAFQQLYAHFNEKVYNTAISFTQSETDAEEVTQDVFVSVFKNAAKFKGASTLSTWIYRITVNTALSFIRKKKRISFIRLSPQEKEQPDFEHPGVLLEKREEAKLLFRTIDTLPSNQKTAFILSFIENLPRQEVADIMEVSLKSVESLLQRAKSNLRKKLNDHYPNRRKK